MKAIQIHGAWMCARCTVTTLRLKMRYARWLLFSLLVTFLTLIQSLLWCFLPHFRTYSVVTAVLYLFLFIFVDKTWVFFFVSSAFLVTLIQIFYSSQTESCRCFSYQTAHYLSWVRAVLPDIMQMKKKIFIQQHNILHFAERFVS